MQQGLVRDGTQDARERENNNNMLPSHALVLLITLASSCLHLISVRAQTYTCDGGFPLMGLNITHCKRLRALDAQLGWNYRNATPNMTVDVVFSARPSSPNGWVSWGVNPGPRAQMVGTRALLAFVQPNGTSAVMTYNITADTRQGCKLHPSEIEITVQNMKSSYVGDLLTFSATLSLPPSAYNISRLNHVWQVGSRMFGMVPKMHSKRLQNMDSFEVIDLTSGHSFGHSRDRLRAAHGVLSVIGWGFLLPIGVIIARYCRGSPIDWPYWFRGHIIVQMSAFGIGTTAWGIGLSLANSSKHYKAFASHWIIGITIFCLACLQMVALWLKPKRSDKYRMYWAVYHHFVGYTLITLTILNIFKGFAILKPPTGWKWAYIGILTSLSCVAFVLEICVWLQFFRRPKQQQESKK